MTVRERVRINGLAVASLVLAVAWLGGFGSVLGVLFGYTAQRQVTESDGGQSGAGLATAGIVIGWLGLALTVLLALLLSLGRAA